MDDVAQIFKVPQKDLEEVLGKDGSPALSAVEDKELIGHKPEIQILYAEQSSCSCCQEWSDKIPEDSNPLLALKKKAVSDGFAILHRKKKHGKHGWKTHSIVVNSPLLKARLILLFDKYRAVDTSISFPDFSQPFIPFIHRWDALVQMESEEDDDAAKQHLSLLKGFLEPQVTEVLQYLEEFKGHGMVTFERIPFVFTPGEIVLYYNEGTVSAGILRQASLDSVRDVVEAFFEVSTIDWDGIRCGVATQTWVMAPFSGGRKITSLSVLPLEMAKDKARIQARLIERGRKFERLLRQKLQDYRGELKEASLSLWGRDQNIQMNERVMLDTEAYYQWREMPAPSLSELRTLDEADDTKTADVEEDIGKKPDMDEMAPLSDRECLLAPPRMKGFALRSKVWGTLNIDGLKDVVWNASAFNDLVLGAKAKTLLLATLASKLGTPSSSVDFDDIVAGKGKGLVFLLQGPPGVGKTLTAETVSEHLQCALYRLDASDLGRSAVDVRTNLNKVLELCARWKAILLLDEADVFLEERAADSLERNELVATWATAFLRLLEYYQGIMILTTNRANMIDMAFESRIDVKLTYGDLTKANQQKIWQNLLHRLTSTQADVADVDLDLLTETSLNGRQIKSAIKTALNLASFEKAALNQGHLESVIALRRDASAMAEG